MKMTNKQRRFVDEYMIDLNATRAAIRAGYSRKRADAIAYENLRKPVIQEALAVAMRLRSERIKIEQDLVIRELIKIAFANIGDCFDTDGNIIPLCYLDSEVTGGIAKLSYVDQKDKFGYTIELLDKLKALELLGKHFGYFNDRHEIINKSVKTNVEINMSMLSSEDLQTILSIFNKPEYSAKQLSLQK